METNELRVFWGKTPKRGDPTAAYHPAIYHMLDVAFVAEALLRDGAPRLRHALLHAWDGCDPDALVAWLPFLIATHDLGKISAAFQGQAKQEAARQQRDRLASELGIVFGPDSTQPIYHAEISAVWLHDNLRQREPGAARNLMWALRDAMGGHHGRFTQGRLQEIGARLARSERGSVPWATWRHESYTLLKTLLPGAGSLAAIGEPRSLRPATVALTGFIILSDWLGSNSEYFPASAGVRLTTYLELSRTRAADAIEQAGLLLTRQIRQYHGFSALFPEIVTPHPLQRAVDMVSDDDLAGPLLAVIEAPTGEGKTETALALSQRLADSGGQDELFFALPTMATGNQMFSRLSRFYFNLYGAAVRLTHSQELLVQEDLRRAALAGDSDEADPAAASAAAALQWFAGSKKAMLAPFGVGTVDQIELGGLNVRHYALRLFALAEKVVVIDEVHAYDTYMSTIIDHTLAWLASLGVSVVLLSATLPASRHRALVASYRRGLGHDDVASDISAELPYPALSLYRADSGRRLTPGAFRPEQRFQLRMRRQQDPAVEAQRLFELVAEGGAVARICNRVDEAQAIYNELLAMLPAEHRVLLHARFPLEERQRRESTIDAFVGPKTARTLEQPMIIVGTQVLEQSLDYDVDVMVSDFAPVDLLLQRAGRLHRHIRSRPQRHTTPILEVVVPLGESGLPAWKPWERIYEPYVLWRSWAVLREGTVDDTHEVVLPRDYRPLIEAVYTPEARIPIGAVYSETMARAWERYERSMHEQSAQARRQLIPDATSRGAITEAASLDFIEDEEGQLARWQAAKTRLGDRVTVVPVYRVDGALALDVYGTRRLDPDVPPPLDSPSATSQKDLLARSVPISDPRIIAAFRDEGRARELRWPWGDLPLLLRSVHPLLLDRNHTASIDGRRMRLDPELGLVIDKEET